MRYPDSLKKCNIDNLPKGANLILRLNSSDSTEIISAPTVLLSDSDEYTPNLLLVETTTTLPSFPSIQTETRMPSIPSTQPTNLLPSLLSIHSACLLPSLPLIESNSIPLTQVGTISDLPHRHSNPFSLDDDIITPSDNPVDGNNTTVFPVIG